MVKSSYSAKAERHLSMDFEFEITGLKLKIKGDDVSGKVTALQQQVQNLMATITALAQGGVPTLPTAPDNGVATKLLEVGQAPPDLQPVLNGSRSPRKVPVPKGAGAGVRRRAEAIDFKHDADQYGFPRQNWATAQKAMWLIYVLGEQGENKEFSASEIAATFNKHFKSF